MGNTDAKGGEAVQDGRRSSLTERMRGTTRKSTTPKASKTPTKDEVSLATRLAEGSYMPTGPPFYAVSSSWLTSWGSFALVGGKEPGPITNAGLVGAMPGSSTEAVWLSADDWHLVHGMYGGGPVLCRASRSLAVSTDGGASSSSSSARGIASARSPYGIDPAPSIALVRRASLAHAARCRSLETNLVSKLELLENGAWAKRRSSSSLGLGKAFRKSPADEAKLAARQRLTQAVSTRCGGEELKAALQSLRDAGDPEATGQFDGLVAELCVHEEAQIVLACLLQAVQDSDRVSLELWLEQVSAMGLDALIADVPEFIGPLNQHLLDLEERERGALKQHEQSALLNSEGPSERMWRISVAAFEEKDEATLKDLIEESKSIGLDVSCVQLLLEELNEQNAAKERAQRRPFQDWGRSSAAGKEPKDNPSSPPKFNDPGAWATPGSNDWKDPATWGNTEDFLDAWRRWKHQDRVHQFGQQKAEQMRREEEQERNQWREREEERSRNAAFFERERRQREAEEERRRQRYEPPPRPDPYSQGSYGYSYSGHTRSGGFDSGGFGSSGFGSGGYGGSSTYGSRSRESYAGGGGSYSSYGGASGRGDAPPPDRAPAGDTGEALRTLGFPAGRVPPLSQLKSAYKKAAMQAHPDRPNNRGRQAQATAEFQKVKAAFDQLADAAPPG